MKSTTPAPKGQIAGILILLTATLLFGLFGVFSRIVGLNLPIFYQNAIRAIVATAILACIVSYQQAWDTIQKKDWTVIIVRNIAGTIAFLSFFFTVLHVPLGTTYFLFYGASTAIGFFLGHFWFSERLSRIKFLSLTLAIIGMLIVYRVNFASISLTYLFLALLSGSAAAVWNTISKKISNIYKASYISFWDNALSIFAYTAASLIVGESWSVPTMSSAWLASNGLGIFYVITGILTVEGFKRIEAQVGSIILLAEIIFAIFFGWLFYQETISLFTFVGGALIIVAIILPELPWKKLKNK